MNGRLTDRWQVITIDNPSLAQVRKKKPKYWDRGQSAASDLDQDCLPRFVCPYTHNYYGT